MQKVVRLRRSTAMIILIVMFGALAGLVIGYVDLRRLHEFDARRDFDVCRGTNEQIYRTVERLMVNATPERKVEILATVQQGEVDCNVYKSKPDPKP